MDGVEVSVMGWSSALVNVSPCIRPSLCEEQSCVYQSRCVLASSANFLVLICPARCGHCARRSESGMDLGMMSLQSSHLHFLSGVDKRLVGVAPVLKQLQSNLVRFSKTTFHINFCLTETITVLFQRAKKND